MPRVTLKDVADNAGVSRATASLVVRHTGRLSEETRARVWASIAQLGYVYHRGAANLRTRRSGLIGLLTLDVGNPFFAPMTRAFDVAVGEQGYLTMTANTLDDPDRELRLARAMLEYPVDALAYVPVDDTSLESVFSAAGIPVLAITRRSHIAAVPYLGPDGILGGRMAADHLLGRHGYRRLAYVGGPAGVSVRAERIAGVQAAVAAYPGAALVWEAAGPTDMATAIDLAARLLGSGVEFDAVVCHSDIVAYAVLAALRGEPGRPPVGVIGFDGLPESAVFWPPVTSVSVGPDVLGRLAAGWLVAAIAGRPDDGIAPLTPHLEIRASCGC